MWPPVVGCGGNGVGIHRRHRLSWFVLLVVFVFGCSCIQPSDAWKLRDLTQPKDALTSATKSSKTMYKEMPMRKIARIVKDIESKDEDENGDGGDQEDGDEAADEVPYAFEKVHTTHFDLPLKPVAKLSQPDVEMEEEEVHEEAESSDQVTSFLDPLLQLTSSILPQSNSDEPGWWEWLRSIRKSEEEKSQHKQKADQEPEVDASDDDSPSWWSYLNRIPFKMIYDFLVTNVQSIREAVEQDVQDAAAEPSAADEPRQVLSPQHFENLLLSVSSFVPNYTNVESIDCRRMGQIFQRQVRGQKLWALQMMDASGKISSGLLRGNANQLGDFDACMEIRTKVKIKENQTVKVKGKYCLASIDVVAEDDDLKLPVHLLQARNMFRSHVDDPSHFIPRFSTIRWALCLPNACSGDDARDILTELLEPFNGSGLRLTVDLSDDDCVVRSRKTWSDLIKANWQISAAIAYFTFFTVVTVVASLNDYWRMLRLDVLFADPQGAAKDETKDEATEEGSAEEKPEPSIDSATHAPSESDLGIVHRILMSFSLKTTSKALFSFDAIDSADEEIIYCIYGLKGLATIFLFFSFKLLMIGHFPFANRVHLTELMNSPLTVLFRAAVLYMDVFLMASGFFAGYKMCKDAEVRFRIPWARRLVGRVVRLLPSVLALVLFSAWIFPHLGSGPQWQQLVVQNAERCQTRLWSHFLFLQNWLPADEQCAPQLQHLAVDMQLYGLAPLIIWLLNRDATWGFGAFGVLNAFSAAIRHSSTISERLSTVVFHGMKLTQLYRTVNIALASPLQRATAFLVGLGLGIMLSHVGRNVQIPKAIFVTGWLTCLWSIGWCFWAPAHLAHKDYVYDPVVAAEYATWAPLVWSLGISWIIFVVFTRNDGFCTKFLTLKPLIFLSRISYQIFCIQFLVLFYSAASVRSADSFELLTLVNPFEICLVLSTAIVSALVFDLPLQAIAKMIVAHGIDADIASEEQRLEEENRKVDEVVENVTLDPIEEKVEEEEEATDETIVKVELPLRRRSYSPVDHAWGADEDDDDPAEEVDIDEPPLDESDTQKAEGEEEEEEEEEAEPESNDTHDPVGTQSSATHFNGFLSSPGGEHRIEDPGALGDDAFDEYSDDELDFSGDSDASSDQRDWVA